MRRNRERRKRIAAVFFEPLPMGSQYFPFNVGSPARLAAVYFAKAQQIQTIKVH